MFAIGGMILSRSRLRYWILAMFSTVVFGELFLSGVVAGNPAPYVHFIPICLYYAVLCFLFSLLLERISWPLAVLVFALYGIGMERYVFGNIPNFGDIPAIAFFGCLYIVLFGLPLVLERLWSRRAKKL